MKQTKISEMGVADRLVVSFIIGFTISLVLLAAGMFAASHVRGWGFLFVVPLAPGFVIATLIFGSNDVGGIIGGLWINAGLYWLLVFLYWRWQIRRRARGEK